ncbi:MAG: tetratricopeptide repeat protein [Chloroflexi bacterium]|nr:tetratricopeptide repeat protein [Chloroflexota bacterium]
MHANPWTLIVPPDAQALDALGEAAARELAALVSHWEAQDLPDEALLALADRLLPVAADAYPPLYLIRGELHQRLRRWDGARADFSVGERLATRAREWELVFAFRAYAIGLLAFEQPTEAAQHMHCLFDTLGRQQRTPALRAHAERLGCLVLAVAGRHLDAVGHARAALSLLDTAPQTGLCAYRQAVLHHFLGICETHTHQSPAVACGHFEAAVALYRRLGRQADVARALNGLGLLLRRMGDPAKACRLLEEVLAAAPLDVTRRATLINLTRCRREAGDYCGAYEALREAQVLPGDVARYVEAELAWECGVLALVVSVYLEPGSLRQAVTRLEEAASLAEVHWPTHQDQVRASLAFGYACLNRRREALSTWRAVEALFESERVPEARLMAQVALAACVAQLGAKRAAQARLRRLRRWARERGLTDLCYVLCLQFPPTRDLLAALRGLPPAIKTRLTAIEPPPSPRASRRSPLKLRAS